MTAVVVAVVAVVVVGRTGTPHPVEWVVGVCPGTTMTDP